MRNLIAAVLALSPLTLSPMVHAQVSPRPPDAVVPVVGSTRGQSNANFKTALQLSNPTDDRIDGWLILQPGSVARRYDLPARSTLSFDDVVGELGMTGLASLDVFVDRGVLPAIVTRAYDDQPEGTTGVTVPAVRPAETTGRGDVAVLIVPHDLTRYRFNIGVRTLDNGATIELAVRDAAGAERHYKTLVLQPTHFEQQPGDLFVGTALRASDSIEVRLTAGSAVVYATTVDNRTNDSSIQVLRK